MIGMYAEPQPKGFGFSDTAFRVFILMASRRLKSDRFFTQRLPARGLHAGRHRLGRGRTRCATCCCATSRDLAPALEGVENPFAPWTSVTAPSPAPARGRAGHGADRARRDQDRERRAALAAPRSWRPGGRAPSRTRRARSYAFRLFGIRTVLLGVDLWRRDDQAREHAVNVAVVVHASDACAAVVAGVKHQLPRRSACTAAAISTVNVVLALAARPRGGRNIKLLL